MKTYHYLSVLFILIFCGNIASVQASSSKQKDDPALILQIATHMKAGLDFSEKKEFKKAVRAFTKALDFQETSLTYMLLLNRGASYLQLKQYDEALHDMEQAIWLDSSNPLAHESQGYIHWEAKQMKRVITSLTKSISLGLRKGIDFYIRGNAYGELGEFKNGIEDLTTALKLGFGGTEVYYDRGYLYEKLELYTKAVQDYSMSLEINPGNQKGLIRRGGVLRCLGKPQDAIIDYSSILEGDPLNVEARVQRAATFVEIDDYQAALKDVEYVSREKLDHPYKDIVLANVYHHLGYLNRALDATKTSMDRDVQDVKIASLFQRGLFFLKQGRITESKQAYIEGISHARGERAFGRLNEAIKLLRKTDIQQDRLRKVKVDMLEILTEVQLLNGGGGFQESGKCG